MIGTIISRAVMQGIPLLFGSTGEILTEKSGNLNLGIPGIMYVGAISGVASSFIYEQAVENVNPFLAIIIPFIACILGSALMGLIYSFITITLRANQNVTGLALTTFGIGIGNFFGGSLITLTGSDIPSISLSKTSNVFKTALPFAKKLGILGETVFSYGFLAYLAIVIAVVASLILNITRVGLHVRAVGENPKTADAAGISVTKYKYISTLVGSAIAGLGGLYYVMDYANGVWSNNGFGDRGWLAIALVIFAVWRPSLSIIGSILFGGLYVVPIYLSKISVQGVELVKMLPYVVTILVLVITSIRNKKENQPPLSLGLSYFREER